MTSYAGYRSIKRKILFEHLEKYRDTPSRTIAKILYKDYPEFFESIEGARSVVRRYRGKHGKTNRNDIKYRKYYENL